MRAFFTLLTALFTSCSPIIAAADEKYDALVNYLYGNQPEGMGYALNSMEYRDFAGDGSGRLSVRGELIVTVDRYENHSATDGFRYPNLLREVESYGYNYREIQETMATFADYSRYGNTGYDEVSIVTPIGTVVPFTGEFTYIETIDGFSFRGRPEYQRPEGRDYLRRQSYFVGTPEFYARAEDVANAIQRNRQTNEEAAQAALEGDTISFDPLRGNANGKYTGFVTALECDEDRTKFGDFHDFGYWEGGDYCGRSHWPKGYYVWYRQTWIVWESET